MKCPVDERELLITHRDGIELDYCPQCRGVWFDRGELEKVIERSNRQVSDEYARPKKEYRDDDRYERKRYDDDDRYEYDYKKKKKKSILSDLLDFG